MFKPFLFAAVIAILTCAVPAFAQDAERMEEFERLASPELTRFRNDAEYRRYIRRVREIYRASHLRSSTAQASENGLPEIVVAAMQDAPAEPEEPMDCSPQNPCLDEGQGGENNIIVTGARLQRSAMSTPMAVTSITNVQSMGVDEGDIVKRIGDYFLVLQDGRIFAVNFRTMEVTDRINVYRSDDDGDPIGADWYDEMLVQDDQIIITAYSYEDDASELSIFRLDQTSGKMERRGVFLISSEDYYDVDNYATRLIGDKLIIHTPFEAEDLASRNNRPRVRRWTSDEDVSNPEDRGELVLEASDIFKPVFAVAEPFVHTISVCPLGNLEARDLRCKSTAFIASETAEMYVSPNAIYLYAAANEYDPWYLADCKAGAVRAAALDVVEGAVFRIQHFGDDIELLAVRGIPTDQFAMDDFGGNFRMLNVWARTDCDSRYLEVELALVDEQARAFVSAYEPAPVRRFAEVPSISGQSFENRFVDDWLLYGGKSNWYGRPSSREGEVKDGVLLAVKVARPQDARRIPLNHEVTRLERVGDMAVVTGYRDWNGLNVGLVKLGDDPQIAGTAFLEARYESEGRSHAFNARVDEDGGGMFAVPNIFDASVSFRAPWWSGTSDISFMEFEPSGAVVSLGQLNGKSEDDTETGEGYTCDVSCIDWYGNARPFFVDGRIFGLMGTELVEARVTDGEIVEAARVDLTRR